MTITLKTGKEHSEYGRYWRDDETGDVYDYVASIEKEFGHDLTEVVPSISLISGALEFTDQF